METCQGLRSNRVAAWPLLVGGEPTICGWGAGVSRRRRLHPCHVANAGGQRPRFFDAAPRGARSRGVDVPKALILGGYGFIATSDFGTKCSEYTDSCGMVSLASYAAYCHLAAVIT